MGKSNWGKQIKLPYLNNKVTSVNEQLQDVIATHFDPKSGSKYWLKKEKELNLNARKDITDFEALKAHLGLKGDWLQEFEDAMRNLPVRDLVPKSQHKKNILIGETGGTTGVAKKAAFSRKYLDTLITFSNWAFDMHGIPRNDDMLFIGPTGPHTIAIFARDIAETRGGWFFTVDLDTRLIKKFIGEGMTECHQRCMKHIGEQVIPILKSQDIGILLTTSKILELLPQHVDVVELGIKGIIHGGTAIDPDTYKLFKEEVYLDKEGRSIPLIGAYGNGHSGVHVENFSPGNTDYNVNYYSPQPYIVSEVVDFDSGEVVNYGERGKVVFYRLTSEYLIPGMPERDEATRIKPAKPFEWDGVQNVDILRSEKESVIEGVY